MKNYKKKFKPLLSKWKILMKDYIDKVPNDLPYWNCERANVGFLAAAIWKSGGVAIEEYWTERNRSSRHKGENYHKGWCDLYGKWRGMGFSLEAKQVWEPKIGEKKVEEYLNQCWKDLKSSRWLGKHLISACFISPCYKNEKKIKEMSKLILTMRAFSKKTGYFVDYFRPSLEPKRLRWPGEGYYPGVILIAKVKRNLKPDPRFEKKN